MQTPNKMNHGVSFVAALLGLAIAGNAAAQDTQNVFIEEILVTATKRAGGISVQDAGVAITAYSENQIDAMYLRDLKAIGYAAPNVQLEDIGTTRGTANFSIRGLGINSSIPSIDPTVGVFIDGMYLGLNSGVVFDTFDLEGIEVLRGPQGLLFGRNVTGGAVLMRTTRPSDTFVLNAKAAYESGNNKILSAVVSAPLGDSWGFKLAAHYNDDGGWFTNLANGNKNFGKADTKVFRGALSWVPTDTFDIVLRAEHGTSDGDGPAAQNEGLYGTTNFKFAIDEEGGYDNEWNHAILEATWDVEFGDGQFTNILGWRDYESSAVSDIDATALAFFSAPAIIFHDQVSNELRYNGTFGDIYLTTGIYYFTQDIDYREQRDLFKIAGGPTFVGGGVQQQDTTAIFAQVDWSVNDTVTINLGGRYSRETKDAKIATIFVPAATGSGCSLQTGCDNYDFVDSNSWNSFSPKIGVQLTPSDNTQLYGFWTKGFRSGGYNLRHTSLTDPNEGFDQEEQSSFEVGVKHDFANGLVRLNVAGFHNTITDMQREVNLPSQTAGVIQLIKNTADATIQGVEAELDVALTDSLFVQMSLGYVDGSYDNILFNLDSSPDGLVDRNDYALELPRLAPWTYGAQVVYDKEMSFGRFTAMASGYRRDTAYYTDNNLGSLRAADMFDASLGLALMDEQLIFSVFGKNLKNESTIGGDTQLPASFPPPGGTFSPLNKGRIYGFEVQWRTN